MAERTVAISNFLTEWAELGGPVARRQGFPVSAMLAHAAVESGWGTGNIFRQSLNPFNLQKWPHIKYPTTHQTFWSNTVVRKADQKVLKSPFNCATSQADAVRQWCEWLTHYGEADGPPQDGNAAARQVAHPGRVAARVALMKLRTNPVEFARRLATVGFGETLSDGDDFANCLTAYSLTEFD
jgi:hypothetical protein